jgi:hypothetical protein
MVSKCLQWYTDWYCMVQPFAMCCHDCTYIDLNLVDQILRNVSEGQARGKASSFSCAIRAMLSSL